MLAHQRAGVVAPRDQGSTRLLVAGAQRVAQGHRDVAQPALVADAADRAALGEAQEVLLAPREEFAELAPAQPVARIEIRQGALLRELVPGADQLAVVAAVDAVADQWPQLERD